MSDDLKVELQWFKYPDSTVPHGCLPHDKRAQACWYYYTIAHKAFENIGKGVDSQIGTLYEGELWMDEQYWQQAKSVAMLYQLESPQEFLRFKLFVQQEAKRLGYPEPREEYMNPKAGRRPT